jgi:SSS family transporter
VLHPLDLVVLAAYLLGVAVLGARARGRQQTTADYFVGDRDLPWGAVCFSVIATETSTLTFIGAPTIAYGGSLVFLQLTFGYLLGRLLVSLLFLPRYFRGELVTAYAYLGERFGDGMRGLASVTFMVTRLLADGVRLFATAIPIRVIAAGAGVDLGYPVIIVVLGAVMVFYAYVGGLRGVVWVEAAQMGLYLGGALLAAVLLLAAQPPGWWGAAAGAGKLQVLDVGSGLTDWLTRPYALPTAVLGGAMFSMASHGADQLIVQRVLGCRSLRDGQKAMVGSGVLVVFQFALFLFVGVLLWGYYGGAPLDALGLTRGDEVFPKFIVEGMPPGVSGLLLAAILAAAASTSLNALAGSTVLDVWTRLGGRQPDEAAALRLGRVLTLVWGAVFIGFALLFRSMDNPVVELGLSIASFTYGGLLGAFLLGILSRRARQRDAVVAFVATTAAMTLVVLGLYYSGAEGRWVFVFRPDDEVRAARALVPLAWPLYTVFGATAMVALGSLLGWVRGSRGERD